MSPRHVVYSCIALLAAALLTLALPLSAKEPSLRLEKKTNGDIEALFQAHPDLPFPSAFNLYRGDLYDVSSYPHTASPSGGCGMSGFLTSTTLTGEAAAPGTWYYLLTAEDACGIETSAGQDSGGRERDNLGSCNGPPPEPVDILGGGTHDMSSLQMTGILDRIDGLNVPRDLEFHPAFPGELWIVNRADHSAVIASNAGEPNMVTKHALGLNNGVHFLAQPAALAFGPGTKYFATAHEEDDYTQGPPPTGTPKDFMGPTLWTNDVNIFEGGHESHYDMLHNSPNAVGIAFERETEYWVYDGYHTSLTHYDFNDDHGLGGTDHRDGVVTRYGQGEFGYLPDVVAHVVYDYDTDTVIAADPANNEIKVLVPDTGTNIGPTQPNYDGSTQTAVAGAEISTLIDGACYDMVAPSGMELHEGLLFISDYSTSRIYAFTRQGQLADYVDTGLPPGTLQGMTFDPRDGSLWVVDMPGDRVLRIATR